MNYNLSQFNFGTLLSTMCSGYSSSYNPVGALFSGVDSAGSGSIFNYVNSTGYYGGTSTETNYNSLIGYGLATVGISLLSALGLGAIQKGNARRAERDAEIQTQENNIRSLTNEIETKQTSLKAHLATLGVSSSAEKSDVEKFNPTTEAKVADEETKVKNAQLEVSSKTRLAETAETKWKSALDALNAIDKTKDPEAYAAKEKEVQSLEDAKNTAIDAKEKAERDKNDADKALAAAQAKEKEYATAKAEALKLFDEIEQKRNELKELEAAKQARDLKGALEDADGNAVQRLFAKQNYTVGSNGEYTLPEGKSLTKGDLRKLINEYKTTTDNTTKENIKKFIKDHESDLEQLDLSEDYRKALNKEFGIQ